MKIKNSIKNLIKKTYQPIYFRFLVYTREKRYPIVLQGLKEKSKIKVVFLVSRTAVWKVDYLYRLFERSNRFEPLVIVCPIMNNGKEERLRTIDETYDFFQKKGYNVLSSYDPKTESYIDIKNIVDPDIVFYLNPYKGLIYKDYYISNFSDRITCYVPYFFREDDGKELINEELFYRCNMFFTETKYHKELNQKMMYLNPRNMVVTGYPGIEKFLDPTYMPNVTWPVNVKKQKKIIWAPHHTIEKDWFYASSCFLDYADFMIEMASKYKEEISIVFKPHPILRKRLNELWGKSVTNNYYEKWDKMDNTSFENGDYHDLFINSDAIIHDSSSFLIEYMYTNKPAMRTMRYNNYNTHHNEFANECLSHYYLAYNKEEIEQFIVNVINGIDPKKEKRTQFFNTKLKLDALPSINIYKYICKSLDIE